MKNITYRQSHLPPLRKPMKAREATQLEADIISWQRNIHINALERFLEKRGGCTPDDKLEFSQLVAEQDRKQKVKISKRDVSYMAGL